MYTCMQFPFQLVSIPNVMVCFCSKLAGGIHKKNWTAELVQITSGCQLKHACELPCYFKRNCVKA